MNVLRKILSSMGTMDAIEFLLSKLKNTMSGFSFFTIWLILSKFLTIKQNPLWF